MIRSRNVLRVPRALFVLLLVVLPVALVDVGSLSATVALAATAAVGSALAVCAVIAARCVPAVPRTRVRTAIRDRDLRTAFLPQRDPDAPGRRRPRAPGLALPATAA
ncbi:MULTISPECIES: DUF6412 domain-containing protein [Streptomyces]|uniref:DUF6412 domain-containing protein n=2 Tax=Streptomyces rochei group TaxID=2867164 RepID=A0AAX3ZIK8_STRRO|nr:MULTISPECIES: DUF6412 domain-containing protein [Streptomyces]WDI18620.1 DUF6412 domain-containing protein [Streptomyces enissocaesilis]KYK09017.1 hypothetical protein AUW26_11220 [Streptomyces sp. CC71]MBJ6619770.1 hypothetical protein [Streptomyces sp. DHE17-7]MBQ0916756.1 hypothetical protein [Streptomyces sp. RM99]MBU8549971.1 hypothetical protein [Streptomyces sp. Osf17]